MKKSYSSKGGSDMSSKGGDSYPMAKDSKLPPGGETVRMGRSVPGGMTGSGDVRPPANGPMGARMGRDAKKSGVSGSGDVRPTMNGPMGTRMKR